MKVKISIPMMVFLVVAQLIVVFVGLAFGTIAFLAYRSHGFQWLSTVFGILALVGACVLARGIWYCSRLLRWGRKPVLEFADDHMTYTTDYKNMRMISYAEIGSFDIKAEPTTQGTQAYFLIIMCDGMREKIFANVLDFSCSEILSQGQRTLDDYRKNKLKYPR